MKELHSPNSEIELLVIQGLLDAHDIPYHVRCGHGAVLPGIYIPHYTSKTIMVPEAAFEDARDLLATVEQEESIERQSSGVAHKVRMVAEAVLFGWFVSTPGQPVRKDQERP